MRRLFFSGLALLIGAPAGWIITQEAPQNNEASAPQDAPTPQSPTPQSPAPQSPASEPTAPLPPTAPNPPLKGAVLPKVEYDIANDPFGGRFFVPRYPSGNRVDGLRAYAAGVRRTNTDPNEAKARQLAAQIRATEDESARKAILVELEALTDDSFETMMRSRREQLAKAGQRLDELVERLEERRQLKSEIVKRRVAELLDQPDPLSWETPADFLAVNPPARFPTPARGTAANDPFGEARAGGAGSFGDGSGGGFGGAGGGGAGSFGGGSGGGFGGAGGGGAGSFGGGSGGGAGADGYRGPANRLPERTQQESELVRLQAELAARRAQLAAQNAALQEQLRAIEQLQAQAEERAITRLKAPEKERAKFEQDSNN